jgi:tRNA (Thr-GGU) A37 N-methylase
MDGNRIYVKGVDALDGSPLLDIKPYSYQIDSVEGLKDE